MPTQKRLSRRDQDNNSSDDEEEDIFLSTITKGRKVPKHQHNTRLNDTSGESSVPFTEEQNQRIEALIQAAVDEALQLSKNNSSSSSSSESMNNHSSTQPIASQKTEPTDITAMLRRMAADQKSARLPALHRLDPLAKELKDNPTLAEGLLLAASDGQKGFDLWQVGAWSPQTQEYNLTEVTMDQAPKEINVGIVDVSNSCTLNTEFAIQQLHDRGLQDNFPFFAQATAVRVDWNPDTRQPTYTIVGLASKSTRFQTVPSSQGSLGQTHCESHSSSRKKHSHFGTAAQASMEISPSRLADLNGTDLMHIMQHSLSPYEAQILHKDPIYVAVFMGCGSELFDSLLDGRFGDIEDYASVSPAVFKSMGKKPVTQTIKGSTAVLLAWDNVVIAIQRAFQLTPKSKLAAVLNHISGSMTRFIHERSNLEPELLTNDFCSIYLNLLLQEFSRVFADYSSDTNAMEEMISSLRVGADTVFYRLAKARLNQRTVEKIDSLYALHLGPQSSSSTKSTKAKASSSSNKSRNNANSSSTTSAAPQRLCYLKFTAAGCTRGTNCRFRHLTEPLTPEQKAEVERLITLSNSKYPDKTPLVAAFGPP
jgi:hypothetical protein